MNCLIMKPADAREEFEQFVTEAGLRVSDLKPLDAIRLMLDFYREVRVGGCHLQSDGDMLLFQWGIFESDRQGRFFEFILARQFTDEEAEAGESTTQLSLTCYFPPTPELQALKTGSKWCSCPDELAGFEYFIGKTPAFQAVGKVAPEQISLTYGPV